MEPAVTISLIVATLSFAAAIWAAWVASTANTKAKQANEISERANRISQEALDLEKLHAPAPWSDLDCSKKPNYRITNTSGQDATIHAISPVPEDSNSVSASSLPAAVAKGDSYSFHVEDSMASHTTSVEISWSYSLSPDDVEVLRRNL